MNAILAFFAAILALFSRSRVADHELLRDQPDYFSPEYRQRTTSPQWHAFRMCVLASTLSRDVVCPFLRASQVDHIGYKRLGKERIWIDVVPLHPTTHRLVTMLRDAGLRGPVNAALRIACLVWLTAYAALGLVLLAWLSRYAGAVEHLVLSVGHPRG